MIMLKTLLALLASASAFVAVQADDFAPPPATATATGGAESIVETSCGYFDFGLACPAGCWATFLNYDGVQGGVDCQVVTAPGYYSAENSTMLMPCEKGFFSNATKASSCQPCSLGSYAQDRGSAACTPCPSGYYQNEEGQSECKECSVYYYDGEGSSAVESDDFGDQFCQLLDLEDPTTAPSVSSLPPSVAPSATPTRVPSIDESFPEMTLPSSVRGGGGTISFLSTESPTASPLMKAPSPTSAPSILPTPQSLTTVIEVASSENDVWKTPFVIAAVSLGSLFMIATTILLGQKRPHEDDGSVVGGPSGLTGGLEERNIHVVNQGNRNLGIAPMHPPEREGGDEEQPRAQNFLSPLPPRNLANPVPEQHNQKPALVTPYHHDENFGYSVGDEEKIPDASFESFERCYEDPEIASGFLDGNSGDMAQVARASLHPGALDASIDGFHAEADPSVDKSVSFAFEDVDGDGFSTQYNVSMSPMSGSGDLD